MEIFKKLFLIAIFLVVFVGFLGVKAPFVQALTIGELEAQINALLAQIAQLQKELTELKGQEPSWCYNFNVNLKYANRGSGVEALQTALKKEGFTIFSDEDSKNDFGASTASAVVGFQEKYASDILASWGLTHGTGYVGKTTRAKLNKLYGCGVPPPPEICIALSDPVCGKDGKTYSNECFAKKAGVEVAYKGECKSETEICVDECSFSGKLRCSDTNNKQTCGNYDSDACLEWSSSQSCASGQECQNGICVDSTPLPPEICIALSDPVCGKDGKTYSNECFAKKAGVEVAYKGECKTVSYACIDSDGGKNYYVKGEAVKGTKKQSDICMDDNRLIEGYCYGQWDVSGFLYTCPNGCENGACKEEDSCSYDSDCSSNLNQFCERDNCSARTGTCVDVSEICYTLADPVCGCDAKTYSNDCLRKKAGVSKDYNGECINTGWQGY